MEHLSQEQIDTLVTGIEPGDDGSARGHLAACAECARRLTRAAQLEADLHDAVAAAATDAAVMRARPAPARAWRGALPVAVGLAVVVFGAWLYSRQDGPGTVPPSRWEAGEQGSDTLRLEDSTNLEAGSRVLLPQDVCRWVTVERGQGPPY